MVPSVGLKKIEVATASVGDLGMVGSSGGKPFSQEKGDMQPTTMRIQLDLMGYTVYSIYIYIHDHDDDDVCICLQKQLFPDWVILI